MEYTVEETIGVAAIKIASEIQASSIISIKKHYKENKNYRVVPSNEIKVIVFKKTAEGYIKYEYITEMSRTKIAHVTFLKRILLRAIDKEYIHKGDRVVFIEDKDLNPSFLGSLYVFDVNKLFLNISEANKLLEGVNVDVIENIIDIAIELGEEGREGKKIGTAFIISGETDLKKYTKQLILNPFEKEEKNIFDISIKESIKEFSQLDGVFIIDKNGKIISTGTYININSDALELPLGLGTRHRNCAALTKETDAIAIVLSESGGIVRIFKNGQVILKFP